MVDGGTCNNMPVNDLTALDSLSGASIVRVPAGYASSFDRHMPVAAMDKQRRRRLCLWWSRLLINPPLFRSARAPEMPLPTMH